MVMISSITIFNLYNQQQSYLRTTTNRSFCIFAVCYYYDFDIDNKRKKVEIFYFSLIATLLPLLPSLPLSPPNKTTTAAALNKVLS